MNKILKIFQLLRRHHVYRVVRTFFFATFLLVIGVMAAVYVTVSLPVTQRSLCKIAEKELTSLLGARVSIGSVGISPFNQVNVRDVAVYIDDDAALEVDELGAGVSLYQLIKNKRAVFTYAEIIGLNARLWRENDSVPLNIQPIIDRFKKDDNNEPSKYDVKIYNIVIRKSSFSYDVKDKAREFGKFDKNHIAVSQIKADVVIPRISNDNYIVNIKRFSMRERSGVEISSMSVMADVSNDSASFSNIAIKLPNSQIELDDVTIPLTGIANLGNDIRKLPFSLRTKSCYITPSDLSAFVPVAKQYNDKVTIGMNVSGTLDSLNVGNLNIYSDRNMAVALRGSVTGIMSKNLELDLPTLEILARSNMLEKVASISPKMSKSVANLLTGIGNVNVSGSAVHNAEINQFVGEISTTRGNINANVTTNNGEDGMPTDFVASVESNGFNLANLLPATGKVTIDYAGFDIKATGKLSGKKLTDGNAQVHINDACVNGYRYADVSGTASLRGDDFDVELLLNDPNAYLEVVASGSKEKPIQSITANVVAKNIDLAELNLWKKYPEYKLSVSAHADMAGSCIDDAAGSIKVSDVRFQNENNEGLKVNQIGIYAFGNETPKHIILDSDIARGSLSGEYHFATLPKALRRIASNVMPALNLADGTMEKSENEEPNRFQLTLTMMPCMELFDMLNMPVRWLQDFTIFANVDTEREICTLSTKIPYLQQKNKLIEDSYVEASLNGIDSLCTLNVGTKFPVKRGPVDLKVNMAASHNQVTTNAGWRLDTDKQFTGDIGISSKLWRQASEPRQLCANVDIHRSNMVFNDTVWTLEPAHVAVVGTEISIKGFEAHCDDQFVKIDGVVSHDSDDKLNVRLQDINLDYIFETLAIPNVAFGGRGTGEFFASNLYSKIPTLSTKKFSVVDFSYNGCVLGNTDIASHWDNDTKGITLDADISQRNGEHTLVTGAIFPTMDSLYLDFDVHRTDVRFLLPYMEAFTSDISGLASGHGVLFGNFKTINFTGDVYAEDVKMRIDYLNTVYSCTDSVHILPNYIPLDGITIYDKYGHTARLKGGVAHRAFHDPIIDISILDAKNLLCYDIGPSPDYNWYGKIFGIGNATIKGEPGVLNIDVNMTSAPGSNFTFVMSEAEAAGEYNFLTFVDRNKKFEVGNFDMIPSAVRELKLHSDDENSSPTLMNVTVKGDITPDMQITLVMDPVGGDKIRAVGSGNLVLGYESADDDFTMRGTYTLSKGSYNFTLQDIIIKNFTINEGSVIRFSGDPRAAEIDLTAIYQLNANLTDLDDSFALDRELNRTNVPVQAVLMVSGDLRQLQTQFDLNFPTLTEESARKVKSIISTDDQMNRQILYLLALNRFYTPEYMSATTNNNEFSNVASSTISSQLGNILGQISDNWNIAPNFRTNKGDFSDVEVDVALSSQLLNNRLLFNGNFGYRDNSLNNSSSNFIGDFDIEYLLTRGGNIRLKAYNHYNDQNYYIKSALTTQGVGVVFKFDFNNPFDLINRSSAEKK